VDHPDDLKFTHWDKKKGSLDAGSELAGLLKALQKRHEGVPWKLFDPAWARSARSVADLHEAFAQRDRLARSGLLGLKKDAHELAGAAVRAAKEKAAVKPTLDAARVIGLAAKAYALELDATIGSLKSLHDKALAALPADESDDEPPSVLLDPRQLIRCLTACRRDPDKRVQFAYVDGKDKQAAVLAMSPRMSARRVFSALQRETGVKTGAYGFAWVEGRNLMLRVDKPLGGLVKKIRAPLRATGFRVAKVILWREDGTVFEQDEAVDEDLTNGTDGTVVTDADERRYVEGLAEAAGAAAEPLAAGPEADAGAKAADAEAAFKVRLKALLPRMAAADAAAAASAKLLVSEAGAQARQRNWSEAGIALRRAEDLLTGATSGVPAAPAAPAPPAVASAAASPGRFVHQAKVRLGWQMARQKLAADLKALETTILAHYRQQPEYADLATHVRRFDTVLGTLDESLAAKLDEALNAADPGRRSAFHEQARVILADYLKYARDEPLIAALDDNPFLPLSTHKTLLKTLQVLDNSLA
jgi:hypothetical protein